MSVRGICGLAEDDLFKELDGTMQGTSQVDKGQRVEYLEELQKRINLDSIKNKEKAVDLLLSFARAQGSNSPENAIISESLSNLLNKNNIFISKVLSALSRRDPNLFICISKTAMQLNHEYQDKLISSLVGFLADSESINANGAQEVYESLLYLGKRHLSGEITKNALMYLNSPVHRIAAVVYSVKLCSNFAGPQIVSQIIDILEKSIKGYFDGMSNEIERDICLYFQKVKDSCGLESLLKLAGKQDQNPDLYRALRAILDENPSRIDDVLDVLHDTRNENFINNILSAFEEMNSEINIPKLVNAVRTRWWFAHPTNILMERIMVRNGDRSKATLLELIKDDEKYSFALKCLRRIGVEDEELSKIFVRPLMLQVYDFFYGKRMKNPQSLSRMLQDRDRLGDALPGKTTMLEHLILHLFSSYNFNSINVDSAGMRGVDLVCFYSKTLDLLVIGCTTGTLKNDLSNIEAIIERMRRDLSEVFKICIVTPVVISTETSTIPPTDAEHAMKIGTRILRIDNINEMLTMLNTGRKARDIIDFIKGITIY